MDIKISSRQEADKLLKHGGFKSVISISSIDTDPGSQKPPYWVRQFRGPKLTLYFDDNDTGPQATDVQRIISFANRAVEPLLIHCTAGISRSSAAALIIHAALAPGGKVDLEEHLDPAVHWPNRRMCELADEIIGSDLEYLVDQWKQRHHADS